MKKGYRKEIKYVITIQDFIKIKSQLESVMEYDANSGEEGYSIRTLYFDSVYDSDLYNNLDGCMEKAKIRLRYYNDNTENLKLEYKCKSGSDGVKYSLSVSKEESIKIISGNFECLINRDDHISKHLYVRMLRGAYAPKAIVEYKRIAFVLPISNIRITFDRGIRVASTAFEFFSKYAPVSPIMPTDRGILEIKYDKFLPSTLKNIIQVVDRLPVANSKYVQGRRWV